MLVAATFNGLGFGIPAGALYRPFVSTVPRELLPPATPLTDQVTAVLLVPETIAENCCDAPSRTCAVAGDTFTAIVSGGSICSEKLVAETIVPGSGFFTVIVTLPTSA